MESQKAPHYLVVGEEQMYSLLFQEAYQGRGRPEVQ